MADYVTDWVFPIVTAEADGDGIRVDFRGTGFLLKGGRGLVITAGHVADSLGEGPAGALFRDESGKWSFQPFDESERHPTEDLAWARFELDDDRGSPLVLSQAEQYSSMQYMLWGYPTDVQYELPNEQGVALVRPDLVYSEGYVRRRLSDIQLPAIQGNRFLELSAPAGEGFSGSPMIKRPTGGGEWQVVGVYVGHRTNETEGVRVGYANRVAGNEWLADLSVM